jgi:iron(III) transport system substrate-binding protein
MAVPLFGTTATHAAVLFSTRGAEEAKSFFNRVAENCAIESGNKQVAQKVAQGRYAFGITDTDDAIIELERGGPVVIVFPDQREDQMGTLLIPNTLCIIKNGPNTDHARQLMDYLLQASVEERLARGASAQIPLNHQSKAKSRVAPSKLRIMTVDFPAAADQWDTAAEFLKTTFPIGGK